MPARMMPSTISLGMWLIFIAAVATKAKVTIPVNTPLAHTINLLIISFLSSGESSQIVDRLARRFVTDSEKPMYVQWQPRSTPSAGDGAVSLAVKMGADIGFNLFRILARYETQYSLGGGSMLRLKRPFGNNRADPARRAAGRDLPAADS